MGILQLQKCTRVRDCIHTLEFPGNLISGSPDIHILFALGQHWI